MWWGGVRDVWVARSMNSYLTLRCNQHLTLFGWETSSSIQPRLRTPDYALDCTKMQLNSRVHVRWCHSSFCPFRLLSLVGTRNLQPTKIRLWPALPNCSTPVSTTTSCRPRLPLPTHPARVVSDSPTSSNSGLWDSFLLCGKTAP
ncbi:hypothetical protein Mapa_012849 [Marchantia paleacea]|nr:hypothetical protein Mapa_012849 [Marchantia paleacea]